ncbi:hypothetical protein [Streptomyces sp. NPDC059894]|uniref:hypothetical protein n=1 Tax=unclassified Streptomyces TaxID=2593676 RepID=UPI00364C39B3
MNTRPGAHLVAAMLGISENSTLNITYRPDEPLYSAATRVIGAVYELDVIHGRVTDAVKNPLRLLESTGRGELGGARVSYALLRTAVPRLGDLLAQQDRLRPARRARNRLSASSTRTGFGASLGEEGPEAEPEADY